MKESYAGSDVSWRPYENQQSECVSSRGCERLLLIFRTVQQRLWLHPSTPAHQRFLNSSSQCAHHILNFRKTDKRRPYRRNSSQDESLTQSRSGYMIQFPLGELELTADVALHRTQPALAPFTFCMRTVLNYLHVNSIFSLWAFNNGYPDERWPDAMKILTIML